MSEKRNASAEPTPGTPAFELAWRDQLIADLAAKLVERRPGSADDAQALGWEMATTGADYFTPVELAAAHGMHEAIMAAWNAESAP